MNSSCGTIYLVDRDKNFCQVTNYCLEQEGWNTTLFAQAEAAFQCIEDCPNLWILEVDGETGFDLMRAIKTATPQVPVLLMAQKEGLLDRVLGLELGCEDMVLKPFSPRELVLRIKRILTVNMAAENQKAVDSLQDYMVRWQERIVTDHDRTVSLTSKEFLLLECFYRNRGIALSREQILRHVWGEGYYGSDRVVDDLVRRMRRKLSRLRVETLYGYGYRLSV